MDELDRFSEQVRRLKPRSIFPDENIEFANNADMLQHPSTFAQSSTKNIPRERIIPIKLIDQHSTNVRTSTALKDWNSSATPVIKRYVYDPEIITHREYGNIQKGGKVPAEEYANIPNYGTIISKYKPHETLINDIPQENQIITKQLLSSNKNGVGNVYMRSIPPPEYRTEAVAAIHQLSNDDREGKAKMKKPVQTVVDIESQQKTLHSQYPKSAVQRQIARRISGGSEHSKSYGIPSQQHRLEKNRQIRQTEQVIKKLEDDIPTTRNIIQNIAFQQVNDQERESYVIKPEMKRSKLPFFMRLFKKKRRHSTSPTDAQKQLDNSFEQPRALETNIDQSIHSPLRSYGRLVRDDEMEERPQDGTIYLSEESATTATIPRQDFRAEKAAIGMKSGYDGNENDELLHVKQLNLEEGLTPHPYKTEPCIEVAVVNRKKDYSAERKMKLLKLLCCLFCPVTCAIAIAVLLIMLLFVF
ncbi:unnamed protein product [Cercopithifilaria johnstoni]|uniref:Uncharacterized protein n=1 Tax=Cercopithifilaria johnstoni TaxID=2874296 RepID=A0A8J2MDK0_9BILA|nr:unnamed protein product [Cercopithifilaria johnstoni]